MHLVIINFNLAGLFVIPLGGWLGWRLVRIRWLRLLHLVLWLVVAAQAVAGQACILTILQDGLVGVQGKSAPMVMSFINRLIYWPLPIWVFAAGYVAVLLYTVALWFLVPPDPAWRKRG